MTDLTREDLVEDFRFFLSEARKFVIGEQHAVQAAMHLNVQWQKKKNIQAMNKRG